MPTQTGRDDSGETSRYPHRGGCGTPNPAWLGESFSCERGVSPSLHRQKCSSGLPRWHFPTGPCFAAEGGASSTGAREPLRPRFPGMENRASILSLEAAVREHGEAEQPLIRLLLTGAASQCSPLGGLILLCPMQERAGDESTSRALSCETRSRLGNAHGAHAEPQFKWKWGWWRPCSQPDSWQFPQESANPSCPAQWS